MKKITKKVATIKGAVLSVQDVHDFLDGIECYFNDEGEHYIVDSGDKVTVRVKGKVVDSKDVTVSFES